LPVSDPSLEQLVWRARGGDVEAFGRVYAATADRVFALCLRMTADRALAEELLQDVFVRAWHALASFRGDSAFTTWLHRIAVNVVLERQRHDQRRHAAEHAAGAMTDDTVTDPHELRRDLDEAIAALPPGIRRAFVLRDVEGFSYREIAEQTGLAEGTLRAQVHRARQLLMEALG
jgi:RNA polymerase sigma-70 factor, ECF subfamily